MSDVEYFLLDSKTSKIFAKNRSHVNLQFKTGWIINKRILLWMCEIIQCRFFSNLFNQVDGDVVISNESELAEKYVKH